jgi:hypothetical protein
VAQIHLLIVVLYLGDLDNLVHKEFRVRLLESVEHLIVLI